MNCAAPTRSSSWPALFSLEQHQDRFGRVPDDWLADGGFAKHDHIEQLESRASKVFAPVVAPKDKQRDRYAPLPTDSQALRQWRERMGTDAARLIYKGSPCAGRPPYPAAFIGVTVFEVQRDDVTEFVLASDADFALQRFIAIGIAPLRIVNLAEVVERHFGELASIRAFG